MVTRKCEVTIDSDGNVEQAIFLGWGLNYNTYSYGIAHYTVAICEYENGRVDLVNIECIRFIGVE